MCIHPTSMTVSVWLTKITGSLSLCTHMLIILFTVWAGIKNEKFKVKSKNQKIKKSKNQKIKKSKNQNRVWRHTTIIIFPQKCIRSELIRPCHACFMYFWHVLNYSSSVTLCFSLLLETLPLRYFLYPDSINVRQLLYPGSISVRYFLCPNSLSVKSLFLILYLILLWFGLLYFCWFALTYFASLALLCFLVFYFALFCL